MMKNLIYKEIKLALHPASVLFMFFGAMLLIPGYPFYVIIFYGCLGVFFTFLNARENRDVYYAALLPMPKRDAVKGRCLTVALLELGLLAVAVPFAFARYALGIGENIAGIEANAAFFGFSLMILAIFNAVYFNVFYKTAYKTGKAFIIALIPTVLFMGAAEALVFIPSLAPYLDTISAGTMGVQLAVLLAGAAVFALGMVLTYKSAARRFEKVDL